MNKSQHQLLLKSNSFDFELNKANIDRLNTNLIVYYLITTKRDLAKKELNQLEEILDARVSKLPKEGSLIVHKHGNFAKWSINATDILISCGFNDINIEKGLYLTEINDINFDQQLEDVLINEQIQNWGKETSSKAVENISSDVITEKIIELYNSEHSRHNIFNTPWEDNQQTFLDQIISTHEKTPQNTLVAFRDNSAVIKTNLNNSDDLDTNLGHTLAKVETHNHPSAINPFYGAASGIGGEIRDEVATRNGGKSIAGFVGYMTSHINTKHTKNKQNEFASALKIILDAPLGASAYSNEIGRPNIAGFFRSFEQNTKDINYAYHKPVVLCGGIGAINENNLKEYQVTQDDLIVLLGSASTNTGLAGGVAASSSLDENINVSQSVQRTNAELQRRIQEVIDTCSKQKINPIAKLHDVGAGGISNAIIELVSPLGCQLNINQIPLDDKNLDLVSILFNETQERYLALIKEEDLKQLTEICKIENCPIAVIGKVINDKQIEIIHNMKTIIQLATDKLNLDRESFKLISKFKKISSNNNLIINSDLSEIAHKVITHPTVADKSFLATIADRSVGGLIVQDQFVGPWQIPVSDVAITYVNYQQNNGRVFAIGERPVISLYDPIASAKIAITEALTNLASCYVGKLDTVKFSLNWMCDLSTKENLDQLKLTIDELYNNFLPQLDLAVITGKDSLFMNAKINNMTYSSPQTLVATAYAHLDDVANYQTPVLSNHKETYLLYLPITNKKCLGASTLAQIYNLDIKEVPDVSVNEIKTWWNTIQELHENKLITVYHDISDGGLFTTIFEMCLSSKTGVTLILDSLCQSNFGLDVDGGEHGNDHLSAGGITKVIEVLFNEQPGAVIEIKKDDFVRVIEIAKKNKLVNSPVVLGQKNSSRKLKIIRDAQTLFTENIVTLKDSWSSFSYTIKKMRDNEVTTTEEASNYYINNPGLYTSAFITEKKINTSKKITATVLKDQGTNGHVEMQVALNRAGFAVNLLSINEILLNKQSFANSHLLVFPGGFTYGDVLGAGRGQAQKILNNPKLKEMFQEFINKDNSLVLGVCNGCQTISYLNELIANDFAFPKFTTNISKRFEARLVQVEILASPSPFFSTLQGSRLVLPVAFGEGRAIETNSTNAIATMRYLDEEDLPATTYPYNPADNINANCGYTSLDGKVTIMMPHPERALHNAQLRAVQNINNYPNPWLQFFVNAYNYLVKN